MSGCFEATRNTSDDVEGRKTKEHVRLHVFKTHWSVDDEGSEMSIELTNNLINAMRDTAYAKLGCEVDNSTMVGFRF